MQFNNIIAIAVLVFASVGMSSPIAVSGDIVSAENDGAVIVSRQGRVVPKPSGPVPKVPNGASAATAILGIVSQVNQLIQGMVDGDLVRRRRFTQETAARVARDFPQRGVIVCNVGFALTGGKEHQETVRYDAKLGTTVTYEVVVLAPGGTFNRQGDGGFENWAYSIPGYCAADQGYIAC